MSFVSFMRGPAGRGTRVLVGAGMIAAGIAIGGTAGVALAIVGVVPLVAGITNICLFAPLFGLTLRGQQHSAR
jgi:hypothetical protein